MRFFLNVSNTKRKSWQISPWIFPCFSIFHCQELPPEAPLLHVLPPQLKSMCKYLRKKNQSAMFIFNPLKKMFLSSSCHLGCVFFFASKPSQATTGLTGLAEQTESLSVNHRWRIDINGLTWENLQETIDFPMKYGIFLSFFHSIEYRGNEATHPEENSVAGLVGTLW